MRRSLLLSLLAVLAAVVAARGPTPAHAEDAPPAIPQLEKHPLFDAKAGEWIRWKDTAKEETQWFVLRVLAVKPGKVYIAGYRTNEDGKEEIERYGPAQWNDVPEFKPKEGTTYKKDEMVIREVNGKKIPCRHLKIEEPVDSRFSYPKRVREVWYSNDVLVNGKVEETVDTPPSVKIVLEWGVLSADELAKQRARYDDLKDFKDEGGAEKPPEKPPEKPGEKPAGGEKPADQPPEKPKDGDTSCGGGR